MDLPSVVVARNLLRSDAEIDSVAAVPRYPLRSNPRVVLVSPLHTPPRRRCIINLLQILLLKCKMASSTAAFPLHSRVIGSLQHYPYLTCNL
jgi:hypothetical protein